MFKATHKGRVTTLSKTLLTAGLLGAAISGLSAGSANAADTFKRCTFGDFTEPGLFPCTNTTTWTLGDKIFTLTDPGTLDGTAPPSGMLSFIWDDLGSAGVSPTDMYNVLASFFPSIPPPSTGYYEYTLEIAPGYGYTFKDVELDVTHAGTGQTVTKTVEGGPVLISVDGAAVGPVPLSGTFIKVKDEWNSNTDGRISSISNVYTQVPAPLPLLGVGAVFGSIRKLRKFSSQLKTFSLA